MDVANIIIITILVLILAWVISYYFLTTNIIFDQILKAIERSSSGTPDKTNSIKNKDFNENSTANFMLSVWFYIDDWGNQLSKEKNILFLGNTNTITTHPDLKSMQNTSLSKPVCNVANNDLINYKNLSVSLDDYQNILNIDIETLPNKSNDQSGCFTRYAIKNIPIQKWNCLIISVDTKTMDIYLDGKLRNSFILRGPYKSELDNAKKNIYLGAQSTENVGFEGYITRVRYEPNSINPKEAYNIYKEGINASLAKSLFNKYSLKVSFLEYNKERGTFTI
tara:strand:+ start:9222 stop:10061 length:840 start_codon:yes stop_codon:yes gene_type:complete